MINPLDSTRQNYPPCFNKHQLIDIIKFSSMMLIKKIRKIQTVEINQFSIDNNLRNSGKPPFQSAHYDPAINSQTISRYGIKSL
jgi:hypothetical protein